MQEAAQPQSPRSCSTDDITNQLLGSRLGICQISVTPDDYNSDGKIDHYRIEMGIANLEQAAVDVELSGLVKVQHHSSTPGSELHIRGTLELQQRLALQQGASAVDLDTSLFRHNVSNHYQLGPGYGFDDHALLQQTHMKNLTIAFTEAGMGPFKAVVDVIVPTEQQILYRPGAIAELNMSFVQWFSLSIIFMFLFSCFESTLFQLRGFDTFVSLDSEGRAPKPF